MLTLYTPSRVYQSMGALHRRLGRLDDAERSFIEAVKRFDAMVLISSGAEDQLIELASGLATLAETQLALDKRADATRSLESARKRLESVRTAPSESLVTRARIDLLLSRAGETGAAQTADRAIDLLRQAVATGYQNVEMLRTDPALDPLRSRADFKLLINEVAMPADAFARGR